MALYKWFFVLGFIFCLCGMATAQESGVPPDSANIDTISQSIPPPAPVTDLQAFDTRNDHGHSITLKWKKSADDGAGNNSVIGYEIYTWEPNMVDSMAQLRSEIDQVRAAIYGGKKTGEDLKKKIRTLKDQYDILLEQLTVAHAGYPEGGEWRLVDKVPAGTETYVHLGSKEKLAEGYIPDYTDLYYRVDALTADSVVKTPSVVVGPVQCYGQWFNTEQVPVLITVILFGVLILYFVMLARKGKEIYVRPIGGIEAVDDAIGRATEMGKPILYVLGLGSVSDVATIAAFTILQRVAKKVAEYQTDLIVPTYDPIVMSVAQDVVKSAYYDAGRADTYKEDSVFFVTQSQFAYVAAVNGIMLRDLPATNVYMGKFYAESLLLAETGALAGSIQISGTDEIAQMPFFIVACDYTLIGEELYAASAYLGREPILLGSLKAQDYAKAAIIILSILGIIATVLGFTWFTEFFHVTS